MLLQPRPELLPRHDGIRQALSLTVWSGVAHGARLRQMERPVDIRQDVPWDTPQLTICKMCLLIMKVKKGKKKL